MILAALQLVPETSRATYLDSDLYFFHSPKALWREIGSAPLVLVEHRFSSGYSDRYASVVLMLVGILLTELHLLGGTPLVG